jgi:CpeT/CpcT family (DUF1001)
VLTVQIIIVLIVMVMVLQLWLLLALLPANHSFPLRNTQLTRISGTTKPRFSWFDSFGEFFSGDFDNYDQVVADRLAGMAPREGGGHEQIHCTLIPLSKKERLAAFYFDGNPSRIFRFRYYKLYYDDATADATASAAESINDDIVPTVVINMKLYTIHRDLEVALRQEPNPLNWADVWTHSTVNPKITELPNCDVQWSRTPDPIQHSYTLQQQQQQQQQRQASEDDGFHAIMTYGEALVESQMMPGVKILVRDQLSLYENEFWIHDRGYNPETMDFIYGNQKLVPYRLKRVSRIMEGTTRTVINDQLKWTLGPEYRSEEEHQEKLKIVGGVSAQMNKK